MQAAPMFLPTTLCTMVRPYMPGRFLVSPQLLTRV